MRENRLNIDLFVPGEVSKSSWMALSVPSYFRPLGVYIAEGLAPTWTGFVNNRSSRTMAAMLIERRKELRVEMTKYFIKNHRFDSVIARAVQTSELPTPFGLGEFTYLDLFSKFLRDIPKIFSEEIEAIENFLKAISPLDYSGMEETVVVKLVSLINYLRELRSTLRVKLKSFTEFKESLSYYPRGIYGIQFFAEDAASLRPRNHVVSDILEMIKLHSEVDAERVIEDRSQCQYDLVADAFIQFLRDYRKARVPSFLSEAIPDEFARF
jgi:Asp-tRNA(Asn)/Glu-tRNA(Gln) amidotransferase C subunit